MGTDPVLREVHRMKDQFARQYDHDLGRIIERLIEYEKKHPERMARPAPETSMRGKRRAAPKKTAK